MNIPIAKRPLLFIVDGSTYIFRAYHALPPLTSKKGIPTNAVYGYTNMLIKTVEQYRPDYFVVVFDSKGPTFRDRLDTEYKANRGTPPDDLTVQFPYIFEITDTMGIQRLAKEGYEADDVIATLTDKARASGFGVVIVGSDKDLMSVVSDDVVMLDTMKDQWITPRDVSEKFGVSPSQMTEFLMLTGDSVDNIKGVQGIGKKTAMDLLVKYGGIEGIYAHIDDIAGKRVKTALIESRQHLYGVTRELVQLRHDVPVDIDLGSCKMPASLLGSLSAEHRDRLMKLFSEFEFRRLIDRLGRVEVRFDYREIHAIEEIEDVLKDAAAVSLMYIDDSMGIYVDRAYCLDNAGADAVRRVMSLDRRIIVHDAKAIHRLCIEHGIDMKAPLFSVELAAYLCNPESKSYSLESLALTELGEELPDISPKDDNSMFDKGQGRAVYVAKGAALLERLALSYMNRLKQDGLEPLFEKIEMPLAGVLAMMEHTGIRVDRAYLSSLSEKFDAQLKGLMSKMQSYVSHPFNPDSPKQVASILFDELKLPGAKKTKTGYSTDSEVLAGLSDSHPFVAHLLGYRGIAKLKNSFVDALPSFVSPRTGRIHTNFIQTGAATGRLASSDPNLQNIPVKDEQGRMIRRAFIADEGYSILSADYSQIELRVMAHLSSDEALMDAFMHDQDIHTTTASGIFHVPVPD
ncbi:MAG: DNA polymerase, partial [Deltaproteobacteria bacterium]|nr:DNA polymerase [Deltaproteobacteria bacterium]